MVEYIIYILTESVIPAVQYLGIWFYLLVILASLLESTIIIGTFVPGTVLLLFFGFTASQGEIGLYQIIISTAVGAIVGDCISYILGTYGHSYIHEKKGLLRLSHIEIGKAFFVKHGGKSVFFGRFIGPLRQVIPFVAGMVHMEQKRFLFLNTLGGVLWAYTYIVVGFYFGSNLQVLDKTLSRVGLIISGVVVLVLVYSFNKRRNRRLDALKSVDTSSIEEIDPLI